MPGSLGFGKDSNRSKSSNEQVTTQTLAPELSAGLWGNVADTTWLRNTYQPYSGPRVADFTPDQLTAQQGARDIYNGRIGDAETAEAIGLARQGANMTPQTISAGMVGETDLSRYQDPYVGKVMGGIADDLRREMQLQNLQSIGEATKAGAFGDGLAVSKSLNQGNMMRTLAQKSNDVRSQAFQNAQSTAADDFNRRMTADQANQNAGLQSARLKLDGANLMGQFGNQRLDQFARRLGILDASGNAQQAHFQRGLDVGHEQSLEEFQQRMALQQAIGQALGLIPQHGQTTSRGTSSSNSTSTSLKGGWEWA